MDPCPICGTPLPDCAAFVDLKSNRLISHGRSVRLRPKAAEILWTIQRCNGRHIKSEDIVAAVWPLTSEQPTKKCVGVHLARAKKMIIEAGVDWPIETDYGSGWRWIL